MTPEEKQRLDIIENKLNQLLDVFYKTNFPSNQTFEKDITIKGKTVLSGAVVTSTANSTGCHIHTGVSINDAGIKTEVGHTCPDGSQYMGTVSLYELFIMKGGTWTVMNIP